MKTFLFVEQMIGFFSLSRVQWDWSYINDDVSLCNSWLPYKDDLILYHPVHHLNRSFNLLLLWGIVRNTDRDMLEFIGVSKFSKVVWKLLLAHVMTKVSFLDQISRPFGQTAVIQAVPALEFSVPRNHLCLYSNCDLWQALSLWNGLFSCICGILHP